MNDIAYLVWRYLTYYRWKSAVLVASIAIIVYLPLGLNVVMNQSAEQLRRRAEATPLLIGSKGSPLELVLRSLYFSTGDPDRIEYREAQRVTESELAIAIPIYTRYETRGAPIVGTSMSYFELRGLTVAAGRSISMLGECVVGSQVAQSLNLQVGDNLLSSSENVFNLAGVYPLKMKVVGVLAANQSPDDNAVFVDLKTTWIIEGLGHGHQDTEQRHDDAPTTPDRRRPVAGPAPPNYNEVTDDNVASFHFHGDMATFPITAVIAVPHDDKSSTLLQGRYIGDYEAVQFVIPGQVMDDLLSTIFTVGRYITLAAVLVGLATLATMALVFALSVQLRRRELETMNKIGASRRRVAAILLGEMLGVLSCGILLALGLTVVTAWFAGAATQLLITMS